MRCAVGVHPHQAHECAGQPGRADGLIRAAYAAGGVVAVGEIGLDYHYDFSPRDVQHAVFVEQLDTARQLGSRWPFTPGRPTTTRSTCWRARAGGCAACFIVSPDRSSGRARALDLGFYLSMAGILTFPKAADLQAVAGYAPADRLLVETDSPFLAPVPHRGRRNEPAFVAQVVQALAVIRGETAPTMDAQTTANFHALFGA